MLPAEPFQQLRRKILPCENRGSLIIGRAEIREVAPNQSCILGCLAADQRLRQGAVDAFFIIQVKNRQQKAPAKLPQRLL